eukprot:1861106-Pyramimonas_sp.AAC.1
MTLGWRNRAWRRELLGEQGQCVASTSASQHATAQCCASLQERGFYSTAEVDTSETGLFGVRAVAEPSRASTHAKTDDDARNRKSTRQRRRGDS